VQAREDHQVTAHHGEGGKRAQGLDSRRPLLAGLRDRLAPSGRLDAFRLA
jgi:hypothetical protein